MGEHAAVVAAGESQDRFSDGRLWTPHPGWSLPAPGGGIGGGGDRLRACVRRPVLLVVSRPGVLASGQKESAAESSVAPFSFHKNYSFKINLLKSFVICAFLSSLTVRSSRERLFSCMLAVKAAGSPT